MDTKQSILLQSNWKKILPHLKMAGEEGSINQSQVSSHDFWEGLGVFDAGELTEAGRGVFESLFIKRDGKETEILMHLLLSFPPTVALQQYLWGLSDVDVEQVLTVLKTTGFWCYVSREPLTHFLDLLNYAGIISYNKKTRKIKILISPDTVNVPNNVFIDPKRPFSNILWIKRVLAECERSISWLDKHFQKEALEWLWAVADAEKIKEIRLLSLDLSDKNIKSETKKSYTRFKLEMGQRGIKVIWAVIDSRKIKDAHDRWIMGGNGYLRNLPNVNAINSGQRSEMNLSTNYDEARNAFDEYWKEGVEI
ncbi:MAG: hypothetical protein WCW31_04010 [Patescibacteria group bacterium]